MLRPYQQSSVQELLPDLNSGLRTILVLPTGAGKTFTFVHLVKQFQKTPVIVCVHRERLMNQALNAFRTAGFIASKIDRDTKKITRTPVIIAMIETLARRMNKPEYQRILNDCKLLVIDEAHVNNFNKLLDVVNCPVLGCTATPVSAGKSNMKDFYNTIHVGVQIPELIENGWLSTPRTYIVKAVGIDSISINKRTGDYDESEQSKLLSAKPSIDALLQALEKLNAKYRKVIMFNANIDHNLAMCDAFTNAGYNVFRVDTKQSDFENDVSIENFADVTHGIMMNVGILTTGYDQPDIDLIIVFRKTKSVALWLQMCGRGSRVTPEKSNFDIVYVGDNIAELGLWEAERDWESIFYQTKKPNDGIAPVKNCIKCESLIPASAKVCKYCNTEQPQVKAPEVIAQSAELVQIGSNEISIFREINPVKLYKILVDSKGRRPHSVTFTIIDQLVTDAIKSDSFENVEDMTKGVANQFIAHYQSLTSFMPDVYKKADRIPYFWAKEIKKRIVEKVNKR